MTVYNFTLVFVFSTMEINANQALEALCQIEVPLWAATNNFPQTFMPVYKQLNTDQALQY